MKKWEGGVLFGQVFFLGNSYLPKVCVNILQKECEGQLLVRGLFSLL